MNKNTLHLVVEYIKETLKDKSGISAESYEIVKNIMQEDRDLALDLHDLIETTESIDGRYFFSGDKLDSELYTKYEHQLQ